ncbi:MAG: PAS domain-containing protein [Vitreoscilla sp.]|nr:PAS domain-containing protein [Vitreoscilla sp.]
MMDAQWSDAPFDLLGRFLRVGVVRLALPARITTWDEATFDILGLAPGATEPSFEAIVERVHPDDRAALREAEKGLAHGPGKRSQRVRYIRPDGGLLYLNLLYEVRAAADGEGLDVAGLVIDETESVQAWRAQWESENLVGHALSVAGISLWQVDLATQRISFNEQGYKILGRERPPGGMPLAEVRDTLHPDDRRLIEQAGDEALHVDRVVEAVARYRDTEGRYRHLLTRRFRHRDAQGRTVGVMGLSIDISELVAERQRSLSLLERMQLVAEAVGVGFWWRDIDAGVFEWDEQMYRMHQRDPALGPPRLDEWIGRHVHPDDRGWMAARQEVHFSEWTPTSDVVFRTVAADGSERWIQSWTRRLTRDGRRQSLGMHVDITERKRAEQRAELERQRDQFAIEAAGIGMWERDLNGTPLYWSPAMYRLRGLDADDPRSLQEIIEATMQPGADAEGHHRVAHSLRTGEPFGFEFEVTWPDGTRRWLASSGRVVRDATDTPVTVAGVNVDITERRMAEQLARERDRAQQASVTKSELMARVSHELRTPMNAVLGFADLMAQDELAPLAPAQGERLARIRSAGGHLLGLIDDLLELSRADQEDRPTEAVPVRLGDLLADALPWVSTLAAEAGVQVAAELPDAAACVLADRRRLGQVLTNLLTNGIRCNRPGGRIWMSVRPVPLSGRPGWELAVHDDGPGLSAQQMERLFEPFNRLGAQRRGVPDTGIDLSDVQQLVQGMGGRLSVDSQPGLGSRFVVCLPAADTGQAGPAPSDHREPATVASADDVPVDAGKLRVLYIEDNPVNELLVREMLALRPAVSLASAPDGHSGIGQALAEPPHLILLDLQLPDMSGIDVLRRLRHEPALASCRIVALSANAMPDDVAAALSAGFNEYWTKPLNLQRFLADMDALLAAHAMG